MLFSKQANSSFSGDTVKCDITYEGRPFLKIYINDCFLGILIFLKYVQDKHFKYISNFSKILYVLHTYFAGQYDFMFLNGFFATLIKEPKTPLISFWYIFIY